MERVNILFAVYGMDEDSQKMTVAELISNGVIVNSTVCRHTKNGVWQYLEENKDCNVVIMSQFLESASPFNNHDFERLVENFENVLFIPLLNESAAGTDLVNKLYNLGILTALYQSDTDIKNIADMIVKGRSRKECKVYYAVNDNESMSSADFASSTQYIQECAEEEAVEHALYVLHRVTPTEFRSIVSMLDKRRQSILALSENEELLPFFGGKAAVTKDDLKENKSDSNVFNFDIENAKDIGKTFSGALKKTLFKVGNLVEKQVNTSIEIIQKKKEEKKENNSQEYIDSKRTTLNNLIDALSNVLIGVTGIGTHVGVTHQAILIAMYLANNGYKVALFDVTGETADTYESILKWSDVEQFNDNRYRYNNIDFCKVAKIQKINEFIAAYDFEKYNFIVVDYGSVNAEVVEDIGRCAKRFLIAGSNPWERGLLSDFKEEYKDKFNLFSVIVRGVAIEERQSQEWLENLVSEPIFADSVENAFSGDIYENLKVDLSTYVPCGKVKEVKKRERRKLLDKKQDNKKSKAVVKRYGTESIYVTSLRHGTGNTHFSVSLGNYLISKGNVGIVRYSDKSAVYNKLDDAVAVVNGVENMSILGNVQYLIFDSVPLNEMDAAETLDLQRANKKVMMCWPDDDYLQMLADYLKKEDEDTSNWFFVFENVSDEQIKEITRIMQSYNSCYLPIFDAENPSKEVRKIFKYIV